MKKLLVALTLLATACAVPQRDPEMEAIREADLRMKEELQRDSNYIQRVIEHRIEVQKEMMAQAQWDSSAYPQKYRRD